MQVNLRGVALVVVMTPLVSVMTGGRGEPLAASTEKPSCVGAGPMRDELWTPEQIDHLTQLATATPKLSARDIAALLNSRFRIGRHAGHFTRNAVISKIHRLGLVPPPAPAGEAPAPAPKPKRKRKRKPKLLSLPNLKTETPPLRKENITIAQRVGNVFALTSSSCRWPVGDPAGPGFFFCGGEVVPDRPYCAGHCRLAYAPTPRREGRPVAVRLPSAVQCEGEYDANT